ncbi:MAG TPA: hypothetical protein VG674_32490 [Amycolatopsis sp.]|nr:hypothetical protein [Amycolatopsis sp.]
MVDFPLDIGISGQLITTRTGLSLTAKGFPQILVHYGRFSASALEVCATFR